MIKALNGFDENNYAYYYAAKQSLQGLFIIFIMPRLRIHASLFCIISISLQTLRFTKVHGVKKQFTILENYLRINYLEIHCP